ncbi:hypothetical protein BEWA_022470 [Theileria equi strain WA]|uniref:Uncharacterized protein n=1 Tax=Theileria equi strain WA TaxID=1537102 RepID=L0AWZ9_THEEQ|nr:hypothetical protein BEWA_022470 [Theileria equi strain WA]AFZ79399.1 hypothetical protein BEWA_022470 [Theileria equi strain WA]|eukprot:XP_004829065.1 hypothetical protein BEWA_022470 [Theileria equi strain WA]
MNAMFHSILAKNQGTHLSKFLLAYYDAASTYYSFCAKACVLLRDTVIGQNVHVTVNDVERVPKKKLVYEIEDMLKMHGFIYPKGETYDDDGFSFDFVNTLEQTKDKNAMSDGDTT